jgi:hypothetical protein
MKILILLVFCFIVFSPFQYSQTQLLKVGNAIQYSYEGNQEWITLTTSVVNINGKEYFESKTYSPWVSQTNFNISHERIQGDSAYYTLTSCNSDSLLFNYNWKIGHTLMIDSLSGQRIDSIKIKDTFLIDDTVYFLRNFYIDPTSHDTSFNSAPEFNHYSKKLGKLDDGLWVYITGIKVNGEKYGEVYPYPEEITFSEDSLYSKFVGDTINCLINNTSSDKIILDSIYTSGRFPYGCLMYLIKDNNYFFINLFNNYPNHPLDTLNYQISENDSVQLQIYDIDLCAICKKQPNEYFEDTLKFVFSFKGGKEYFFSKIIPISGEGHPSAVEDEKILPTKYVLYQNYPNPFNPSTAINYQIPVAGNVILKTFDVLGNEVAILVDKYNPAGNYAIVFDASKLSSGIYFYQLKAGEFIETKKMILMK